MPLVLLCEALRDVEQAAVEPTSHFNVDSSIEGDGEGAEARDGLTEEEWAVAVEALWCAAERLAYPTAEPEHIEPSERHPVESGCGESRRGSGTRPKYLSDSRLECSAPSVKEEIRLVLRVGEQHSRSQRRMRQLTRQLKALSDALSSRVSSRLSLTRSAHASAQGSL
ncbi:MAG: hypothetical protein SGPRY_008578 [Prymnesium sp.]